MYVVPYDDGGPRGFASRRSKLDAALASMRGKSDIAAGRRETEVLETSVKAFSKSALVLLALAVAGTPARSRSLHIAGTAGYLSEWEFDGEAAEAGTGGELVGPLVWKHIGLCSVNGPEEKPGKIRIRLSGGTSKIDATIFFDSTRCTYSGNLSGTSDGLMDCPDAGAIPLSISIK
jgi:hypothetical protein